MIPEPCSACQGQGFIDPDPITEKERHLVALLRRASRHWGVRWQDIVGPRRFKAVTHARFWLEASLRYDEEWSLKEIGWYVGGRDHATVHHGIQRAIELGLHPGGEKMRVMPTHSDLLPFEPEPMVKAS